jgi:hypothetical protein
MRVDVGIAAAQEAVRLTSESRGFDRGNALAWAASLKWTARDAEAAAADCRIARVALGRAGDLPGVATAHGLALQLEGEIHLYRRDYRALAKVLDDGERAAAVIRENKAVDAGPEPAASLSAYLMLLQFLRDTTQGRFAAAAKGLERVRARYEELGDPERLMFILMSEMRFRFRDEGDLKTAESLALRVGRTRADDIDISTVRARVLAAEVLAACGRTDESEGQLRDLAPRAPELDPRMRVLIHVRALVLRSRVLSHRRLVRNLCEALREITPTALRLRVFADQLYPLDELALSRQDCAELERALGGAQAYGRWTLDRPTPSAVREAHDVARVALVLGRTDRCAAILDALGAVVRTQRFETFLTMVQGLELDAARSGYGVPNLAPVSRVGSWEKTLGLPVAGMACVQEGALYQLRGEESTAAEFARRAEKLLSSRGEPPTGWKALAYELLAACSPRPDERQRARRSAIEYYIFRGERAEVARLEAWTNTDADLTRDDRAESPITLVLTRDSATNKRQPLAFVAEHPPGRPMTVLPSSRDAVWHGLGRDASTPSVLGLPKHTLDRFVAQWRAVCMSLGSELHHALRRVYDGNEAVNVELQLARSASLLEAIPWELALITEQTRKPRWKSALGIESTRFFSAIETVRLMSRHTTLRAVGRDTAHMRWIQRMLTALGQRVPQDGVAGPSTLAALRAVTTLATPFDPLVAKQLVTRVASKLGTTSPRLFAVIGDTSLALRRGTRARSASAPSDPSREQSIDLSGFDVTTVNPRDRDVTTVLMNGEFDVVLLTGSLRADTRRGGVVLDFARSNSLKSGMSKGAGLDASQLSKLIWRPNRPLRPIVLIDAQVGGGMSERIRALFMRNIYCGELATHESAAAVIGMGLESEYSSARVSSRLLKELRSGNSIGSAVTMARASDPTTDAPSAKRASWEEDQLVLKAMATRGIALWSSTPHHVFVPSS